ncbi:MAG: MFS transporter [Saccharospirillum sp.]|uniref:MFS transporter n=1 Tax=Saccharospirillum sp. TaxID=2033801 RepID=UPI0032976033
MSESELPTIAETPPPEPRPAQRVRDSLTVSMKDSVASSVMTGTVDQFLNAFAIFLRASSVQIGWLTGIPQLLGGLFQILSVWLGGYWPRRSLIVLGAAVQTLSLVGLCALALPFPWPEGARVPLLIGCAIVYHGASNLAQPQWKALMGNLVPPRLRGRYFGVRSRLAMATSFFAFLSGGLLLNGSASLSVESLGFAALFLIAVFGRGMSTRYLHRMYDPYRPDHSRGRGLMHTLRSMKRAFADQRFRRFTLFLAGMQCMVALSAPFFAVYMLRDLQFTYLQFTLNTAASILVQFVLLRYWGRIADRKGNRYVMALGATVIPVLPVLWLFSDNLVYLMGVQMLGGAAWAGFTLATSNFLYDLKPDDSEFAGYAAMQSTIGAAAVFVGAISGGYLISWVPNALVIGNWSWPIARPIWVIFVISAVLRAVVALWYLPRAPELRVKQRGRVRDLVFRVSRFTPISGVVFDVVSGRRKKPRPPQ